MRYTTFFGKTVKSVSKQIQIPSHQWLVRGGFIRESAAGRYFLLPLGMRVKHKIMAIIRAAMDEVGALEMSSPLLHPLELWQESNRDQAANFGLMLTTDRRQADFALGGTAEEMFTDVVRKFALSYKELPFNLYQFSQKFRDELRARGGLLRVREFTMKDAYSFDHDEAAFVQTYQTMTATYQRIFKALGLETAVVPADNGYIGGEYSHEFVVDSEVGETRYLISANGDYCAHQDVATFVLESINLADEEKSLTVVEQPAWVKSIDDMAKYHTLPTARLLKTVAYKNTTTNELVIAVIRGDLSVNKAKLEQAVQAVEQLAAATQVDLARIGTKLGYIWAWGHSGVRTVGDLSLQTVKNFVGGQKTAMTDVINVNYGRDFQCDLLADIALAEPGFRAISSGQPLVERRGIEVGNIFQLGHHYSNKMEATFIDQDGQEKAYYMGCYGIGIERTLQTIAEIHRDKRGLIWPDSVAPFQVHLLDLGCADKAARVYQRLREAEVEVLYDDRDGLSAGAKFADADLIGCPIRLVVSKRTGDLIEWKRRAATTPERLSLEAVLTRLK